MELTPDLFITALAKFMNFFHKLAVVRLHFYTPVSYLECQQIQSLLKALYNSSFYNKVQRFEMVDMCTRLQVENVVSHDKMRGIARLETHSDLNGDNHSGNSRRTLFLTSGLLYEDWRIVTNFYLMLGLVSKFQSDSSTELCTNKKMHSYFS